MRTAYTIETGKQSIVDRIQRRVREKIIFEGPEAERKDYGRYVKP